MFVIHFFFKGSLAGRDLASHAPHVTSALAESGILGEPEASADSRLTDCERLHPPGRIQTGVVGVSNPIGASCVADGE